MPRGEELVEPSILLWEEYIAHFRQLIKAPKDFDEESRASVSSEELEREDEEIKITDELPGDMNKTLGLLFQTEEDQLHSKEETLPFAPLEKQDIPPKLHSILEASEI